MADRLGVSGLIGRDGLRSLTGCYRRDCVSLVSGCRDASSVLSDKGLVDGWHGLTNFQPGGWFAEDSSDIGG